MELDGERFDIRANVTSIGGYSAHADQQGLVEFVTGMEKWPTEIRVVHGEEGAKEALAGQLRKRYVLHNKPLAFGMRKSGFIELLLPKASSIS